MKTLVYTTAFGTEQYFLLAEAMLQSLRKRGYVGDVFVITDRDHSFPEFLNVNVLVLPIPAQPLLVKAALPSLMDVSAYDKILFVDTDVVFLKNPASIFELADDRLAISVYRHSLQHNPFNRKFFSGQEKADAALKNVMAINTGVVVFPGTRTREWMGEWSVRWKEMAIPRGFDLQSPNRSGQTKTVMQRLSNYELQDQPVMQALVTRGVLDYEFIPHNLLLMPMHPGEDDPLHPETVLLHLHGPSRSPNQKQRILEVISEFTALDNYEEFKTVCDRLRDERNHKRLPQRPAFQKPSIRSAEVHS